MKRAVLQPGLILTALIGFFLPWTSHISAGLTANAYDLAEWAGLSPLTKMSTPQMITPLFVRLVLVGIGVLIAFEALRSRSVLARRALLIGALLVAFTLQPPLGFFTSAREDVNYRQLFALSMATFAAIGAVLIIARVKAVRRHFARIEASIAALTAISGIVGAAQAFDILQRILVPVAPSVGLFVCLGALVIFATITFTESQAHPSHVNNPA